MTDASEPRYRCPHCNVPAGLVSSPVKAACLNEICAVITFNPSIPPLPPLDEWERRVGVEQTRLPEGLFDDPNLIAIDMPNDEDRT